MFPAFPKIDRLFLLRYEGGEHRQAKILLYFNCKDFPTSGKHRMEMEETQQDSLSFPAAWTKVSQLSHSFQTAST